MSQTTAAPPRILVVEDHEDLADALSFNLQNEGFAVDCVRDGRHALMSVRANAPDLVLLDLGLPRMDGFALLEQMRADDIWCPVLILSARGAPEDKVQGFRLGADDYVTKPFTLAELLSRVRAILRRAGTPVTPPAPQPPADVIGFADEELVERFGLTLRQAAVARLLARGLSNPEIAETLGITRLTARNHVEHVLGKLDISGRGRVAATLRAMYDAERGSTA